MAGPLDTYNCDIIAVECPRCGAKPKERCGGSGSLRPKKAHPERIRAAGYTWNKTEGRLEQWRTS